MEKGNYYDLRVKKEAFFAKKYENYTFGAFLHDFFTDSSQNDCPFSIKYVMVGWFLGWAFTGHIFDIYSFSIPQIDGSAVAFKDMKFHSKILTFYHIIC